MPSPTPPPAFPARYSLGEAYHLGRGTWPKRAIASARIELPPDLHASRTARRAIDQQLGPNLTDPEACDLRLLVGELVANAVLHGAHPKGPVLHLALSETSIRAEVCDRGAGFELPKHAPRQSLGAGGYGLTCLDRLATRWGVSSDDGTCVWLEIARGT